jgi:hypothetical protein
MLSQGAVARPQDRRLDRSSQVGKKPNLGKPNQGRKCGAIEKVFRAATAIAPSTKKSRGRPQEMARAFGCNAKQLVPTDVDRLRLELRPGH